MKQRLSEIINENNALEKSLYILKQRNLLIDSKHIKTARVYQAVFCAYRLNELTRLLSNRRPTYCLPYATAYSPLMRR